MKKSLRRAVVLAAAAAGLALVPAGAAHADSGQTYTATLNALNGSGGSGMLKLNLSGDQATVTENWSGLAATFDGGAFPHVQHIHIDGKGQCPTSAADKNGDGVVNTIEGQPSYGTIGATLSTKGSTSAKAATNIKIAPGGSSTSYHRTITLDSKTADAVRNGNAVIVVHGLDPSTLSKKAQAEKSPLVPSLPLAATSPALCGSLTSMPAGAPQTGAGSTAGVEHRGMFALGGGLVTMAGAVLLIRRHGLTSTRTDR
jgi:hypothetical protein